MPVRSGRYVTHVTAQPRLYESVCGASRSSCMNAEDLPYRRQDNTLNKINNKEKMTLRITSAVARKSPKEASACRQARGPFSLLASCDKQDDMTIQSIIIVSGCTTIPCDQVDSLLIYGSDCA